MSLARTKGAEASRRYYQDERAKAFARYLSTKERWILLQTMIVRYAPHWHPDDINTLLELELVCCDGDGLRVTPFGERVRRFTTTTQQGESA